ncbi:MAG: hypothetical protein WDN76_07800 [Alphaproteobacteria bacterium]
MNTGVRAFLIGLVLAATLGASACQPSTESGARLRLAFPMPTSWDPVTSRTGADINTVSLAYASLTRLTKTGNVEPALAESWRYSGDGRA